MPKAFLLKRRSFVGSSSRSHDTEIDSKEKEGRRSGSAEDATQETSLTDAPKRPEQSPHIVRKTNDVFTDARVIPLKYTAEDHFPTVYSPFYHLAFPGAANPFQESFQAYFNNVQDHFRYMHATGFRNENSKWGSNLNTPHPPVYNSEIFKSEIPFAAPPEVILPNQTREPYRCDQCGKIFKTKYTLAIHLKMPNHTFARPFVCNTCGKGFRLSSTLCRHKIIHTKEKPYKCTVCLKAFNRSSTLKTHLRTHSLEKEFVCEQCGKGFHQKGNLRNHILIHTGEKPYKCTLCQKAFNKLSNLKFHMHVHADNSPYRCGVCKVSFSRRCDLRSHLQSAHSQKESEF